jgi:hypothetical protein
MRTTERRMLFSVWISARPTLAAINSAGTIRAVVAFMGAFSFEEGASAWAISLECV